MGLGWERRWPGGFFFRPAFLFRQWALGWFRGGMAPEGVGARFWKAPSGGLEMRLAENRENRLVFSPIVSLWYRGFFTRG